MCSLFSLSLAAFIFSRKHSLPRLKRRFATYKVWVENREGEKMLYVSRETDKVIGRRTQLLSRDKTLFLPLSLHPLNGIVTLVSRFMCSIRKSKPPKETVEILQAVRRACGRVRSRPRSAESVPEFPPPPRDWLVDSLCGQWPHPTDF